MSSFDAASTADDVLRDVDLSGRTVVITGASAGLGVETARAIAARGAHVVAVVRDVDKARHNLSETGAPHVELHQGDLASLASVRAATDAIAAEHPDGIDVMIANAAIMACPQSVTVDGHELQFGTNHLGHFVLVNRLAPLLLAGGEGRVVMLSSSGHNHSDVDLNDPDFERTPYDAWAAYGRAKTANVLFAVELDRRLRDRGVRATAVHPGGILTELGRHLTDETFTALIESHGGVEVELKSLAQGAATTVWAGFVADGDQVGGRYCEDCAIAPIVDDPRASPGVMRYALDPATAAELWTRSEELVGERFDH